ncbi:hypothetical protein RD149_18375 [Gordonia westfalica]|uniref:Uncharacterized protein n=1 Tax=Gordonia westfalica TaxID=158898 RepID=A0ABU2GW65_9ACTN|nr:hypothetical protein [Gordonia westfalica]MDS1115717.1 hypothetical protein [Gordonia westfalica]
MAINAGVIDLAHVTALTDRISINPADQAMRDKADDDAPERSAILDNG